MKLIHTGDLHIGHQLYGYDRLDEHEAMLGRLREIVLEERPDALIISGDIFHTSSPSIPASTLFATRIKELTDALPEMSIVAIAGNHDSGSRHEIFREPWKRLGVTFLGVTTPENLSRHIIPVGDKGYVVALPYTHPRNIPDDFPDRLQEEAERINTGGLPVILAAHTTVAGCDSRGHERRDGHIIGGIDSIPLAELGEGYDYIALGHIHAPQFIGQAGERGAFPARYAGSPLAVSFDEDYVHSVSVVEIDAHGTRPSVRIREIVPKRRLLTLPSREGGDLEEALEAIDALGDGGEAYVRINLKVDDVLPQSVVAELQEACTARNCRFCLVNPIRPRREGPTETRFSLQEFRNLPPEEIFHRYLADKGLAITAELDEMFRTATNGLTDKSEY